MNLNLNDSIVMQVGVMKAPLCFGIAQIYFENLFFVFFWCSFFNVCTFFN